MRAKKHEQVNIHVLCYVSTYTVQYMNNLSLNAEIYYATHTTFITSYVNVTAMRTCVCVWGWLGAWLGAWLCTYFVWVSYSKGMICTPTQSGVVGAVHRSLPGEARVKLTDIFVWLLRGEWGVKARENERQRMKKREGWVWTRNNRKGLALQRLPKSSSQDVLQQNYWREMLYQGWLVGWLYALVQKVVPVDVPEERMFL